jgi:hypothetical protein
MSSICPLPGGTFERGTAEKKVTTILGNLALQEGVTGISEHAVAKERSRYYSLPCLQNTSTHELLPIMAICHQNNKDAKNGQWEVLSEAHKLKIWAFILAAEEMQSLSLVGNELATEALEKMTKAAKNIQVTLCEYEDDEAFTRNYNEAENADHDQMQKTNSRFTNRGKMFLRARIQVNKKKSGCNAQDIVVYFQELEAKQKIKTTFSKNRVTSADDVTRVEKVYSFLQNHHLDALYEKLEWSPEVGPTPLSQWATSRYFMAVVEGDGEIAKYLLKVLENTIYCPEDPASKLKKDKVCS